MTNRKTFPRNKPDFVSEEMVAALLAKSTFEFNELFLVVHERLRARNATSGGEEMLRLRVYEKLQVLAAQGLVKKDGKKYSAVRAALKTRQAEMVAAKAAALQRRGATLHVE